MSCEGASRLVALELAGPAGRLEAVLQECDSGRPAFAALVCHPHPLYGGTMHNKVVHRVAATLHELGGTTLRFNFRGVGASEGRYDEGRGELEDARAALGALRGRVPGAPLVVAGFSFGARMAAELAVGEPEVARLVLVAPPVQAGGFEGLRTSRVPKLVVQGTADEVCPPGLLEAEYPAWAEPKQLVTIEGASHFFDRQLGALAKALLQGLTALPWGRTS